jgi:hypothetical protein
MCVHRLSNVNVKSTPVYSVLSQLHARPCVTDLKGTGKEVNVAYHFCYFVVSPLMKATNTDRSGAKFVNFVF